MKYTEWTNKEMRMARLMLGLTQWQLALMTQISQTYIWAIESGYKKPNEKQKEIIAEALNSTPEELFPATNKP